ncbi:hypothetical protein EVAR_3420_1 [Eumeta japonica]|uniref:Endonuclease/exonuclease/phosphatase domain-containing protein n=1 Tax=Eumeta variegata TaxID=151549 RepID=A0A4C1SSE0_EUMVA|nr:hypothetical protein EVAR_3420_1 [Eumeta japonica]
MKEILRAVEPTAETPMILCGDFNSHVYKNESLLSFLKEEFSLECCQTHLPTLGNTYLALTSTRKSEVKPNSQDARRTCRDENGRKSRGHIKA